jgi:hypothetical protein
MNKKRVLLDTNSLLIPVQFGVDIFSHIKKVVDCPFDVCIIDATLGELKKILETGKGADREAARVALLLIKQKDLKILRGFSGKSVDDAIVEAANQDTFVLTQDRELKKRLKKKNIKILTMKQKKHLGFS